MKIFNKIVLICLTAMPLLATSVKNIDTHLINLKIKNNNVNIISFPFVISDAQLITADKGDFKVIAKRDSVTIIANALSTKEKASVVIWSEDGYNYLLNITPDGKEQYWNLTSNRVHKSNEKAQKFETGRVDKDIKKLIKFATKGNIPGYKKIPMNRKFNTRDFIIEKKVAFDGPKYRVEKWYLQNKRGVGIQLDYGSFYTKGIIAISFENSYVKPHKVARMYVVINKATIENSRIEAERLR